MIKPPVRKPAWRNKAGAYGPASAGRSHKKNCLKGQAPQAHSAEKARAYAFLLLKYRLRSENELLGRLKQKGFSADTALETVKFLKEKEFIDDRVFAKGWVNSRLRRPLGLRKISQELAQKGLDKEIIRASLVEAKEGYDESRIVEELAQKRFSKLKGIEPLKARARVYGYLIRRGFSPDVVSDIINSLKH